MPLDTASQASSPAPSSHEAVFFTRELMRNALK
jgi:hypothetical protein